MASARAALRRCKVQDGVVTPCYVTERDYPDLRDLLEVFESFVGQPLRRLEERLKQRGAPRSRPDAAPIAIGVLRRLFGTQIKAAVDPVRARAAVFPLARGRQQRAIVLSQAATALKVSTEQLAESLLADLPGERRLTAADTPVTLDSLALRCNLSIQQALLQRSTQVMIRLEGNSRAIVRHAKLRGLICTVDHDDREDSVALRLSGPLSLFRRTTLYGRALGELVPLLGWCQRFQLAANCVVRGATAKYILSTGDPVFPAPEPRQYDSRLETQFARQFVTIAPAWDLVREPEPVAAGGTLIFPDFLIRHRTERHRRWLLEIIGFWTADYLRKKLDRLRAAHLHHLILCIDAERRCSEDQLPPASRVVWYRRRIDAAQVLHILDAVARNSDSA